MTLAFTFPGQGSQAVGMLADLAAAEPVVRDTFAEASQVLGYDLWELASNGPEERLNATEQTQPAMLTAGIAVARAWAARGGASPALAAGHSLGEYSALVCAGSIAFADAVAAVAARGRFMQEAVPRGHGAIAALLGLDDGQASGVCEQASDARAGTRVWAVNFNAPGQVAIAGHAEAVDRAITLAQAAGARRAVRLPMSVPVHCELMTPAMERLAQTLAGIEVRAPAFPVVQNSDNATHDTPRAIREALAEQLRRPVRWVGAIARLRELGARVLVEPGPGRVLTGLNKRIDRELVSLAVHDGASLDAALAALEKSA